MNEQAMLQRQATRQESPGPAGQIAGPQHGELARLSAGLNARPAVQCLQATAKASEQRTGLPDGLKAGIEALSGMSMDAVRVHYNSTRPAQFQAHGYAQGTDIHLAPGREQDLPHEAWHVVQQAQGRVKPTVMLRDRQPLNNDSALEREADLKGAAAAHLAIQGGAQPGEREPDRPLLSKAVARATGAGAAIQARPWEWDGKKNTWLPQGWVQPPGDTFSPMATWGAGTLDGEARDDGIYTQSSDAGVQPFLGPGQQFMGEDAYLDQLGGKPTTAKRVRVSAQETKEGHGERGLHEVIPTSMAVHGELLGNPNLIATQSGFRTSTATQVFKDPGSAHVGTHTGVAQNAASYTSGQKAAHDVLRQAATDVTNADQVTDAHYVLNHILLAHLRVTATKDDLLNSTSLSGMQPYLGTIGLIEDPSAPAKPNLEQLADVAEEARESAKRRGRSLKRTANDARLRSPSPPRGGRPEVEDIPTFPGTVGSPEWLAHASAWLSQHARLPSSAYPPK